MLLSLLLLKLLYNKNINISIVVIIIINFIYKCVYISTFKNYTYEYI